MRRFFCEQLSPNSQEVSITNRGEIHHIQNVLRLKQGQQIHIFNGKGEEATGTIIHMTTDELVIKILSVAQSHTRTPSIILACAIPKKSKFELIIEKATELGVAEIIPVKTQRTEINLKADRLEKKQNRFAAVALSAAKQCQRSIIPIIHPVTEFQMALQELSKTATVIIPSLTGERINLLEAFNNNPHAKRIAFFIGPEGDFTPEEYAQAQNARCISVTLGPTILRVETAAICTIACANIFYAH